MKTLGSYERIITRSSDLSSEDVRILIIELAAHLNFSIVKEDTPDYTHVSLVKEGEFYETPV